MKKFCVYALVRKDNYKIFYIGKGLKKRAYEKRNRNEHCTRVMNKYGYYVEIIEWFDNEAEAFMLEIEKIKEIGIKNLTNITIGGEGATGRIPSIESRLKCSIANKGTKPSRISIDNARIANSKQVICSNGMIFPSVNAAVLYIRENTQYKKAAKSAISAACNGYRIKTAYKLEWNFLSNGEKVETGFIAKVIKNRKVMTSCGLKFNSISLAINFLKKEGFEKAQSTNIIQSCKKENRNAYGFKWIYDDSK